MADGHRAYLHPPLIDSSVRPLVRARHARLGAGTEYPGRAVKKRFRRQGESSDDRPSPPSGHRPRPRRRSRRRVAARAACAVCRRTPSRQPGLSPSRGLRGLWWGAASWEPAPSSGDSRTASHAWHARPAPRSARVGRAGGGRVAAVVLGPAAGSAGHTAGCGPLSCRQPGPVDGPHDSLQLAARTRGQWAAMRRSRPGRGKFPGGGRNGPHSGVQGTPRSSGPRWRSWVWNGRRRVRYRGSRKLDPWYRTRTTAGAQPPPAPQPPCGCGLLRLADKRQARIGHG
ncbi:hypothetical protein SHIRM173S_06316 [Streptomyces hirsutus]